MALRGLAGDLVTLILPRTSSPFARSHRAAVLRRPDRGFPKLEITSRIVSRADASAAPIPPAELLEVVGRWPDEAAELPAKVTVPVQYLAFEFERLWCIDADSTAAITAAPLS